jgi:hypothetical protein
MAAEPRPLKTPAARIQRGFAMLKLCNLSHAREGCEQRGIGSTAKLKSVKDGHHDIRRASFRQRWGVQVVHSASMAILAHPERSYAPYTPRALAGAMRDEPAAGLTLIDATPGAR